MMNFLDLSSASDEERRLIREILSDTSVVNIAEPKRSNVNATAQAATSNQRQNHNATTENDYTPNLTNITSSSQSNAASNKHRNIISNHHISINSSTNNSNNGTNNHISSGDSSNSSNNTLTNHNSANPPTPNYTYRSYGSTKNSVNNDRLQSSNDPASTSNHINHLNSNNFNNDTSNIIANNSSPVDMSMPQTSSMNQHLANTMPSNNAYNQHHQHHHHNIPAAHNNMHNHVPNHDLSTAKLRTLDPNNDSIKNQTLGYTTQDTSIQAATTTTTVTTADTGSQATTVPPAPAQMPQMHGDINPVIGMDMSSSQPPGYAMPPHVTAFGPPPPHRVYGGHPIFHPYHYLVPTHPYSPYMPYVALGPPNNVVPTRQQVPPQTNQPPSATSATMSSLPRNSNQQHEKSRNVAETTTNLTSPATAYSDFHHDETQHLNTQVSSVPIIDPPPGGAEMVNTSPYEGSVLDTNNINAHEQSSKTIETVTSEKPQNFLPDKKDNKVCTSNQVSSKSTNINGEEMVKLSSDEGFETQSSLDVSKQSNESLIPHSDQCKVSTELSDKTTIDYVNPRKSNDEIKSDSNSGHNYANENISREDVQLITSDKSGLGSASSKSWASLFKAGGNPSLQNGDIDHNNVSGSENSDEENKASRSQKSTKMDRNVQISNNTNASKERRSQDVAKRALDKMAPKLAQKIASINLKHSLPFLKPRGFINKGNGCYINATLQALIACPPFYNLMKEVGVVRRENSCTPILDSFAELFLNFPPLDTNKKNKQTANQEQQKLNINNLQAEAIEPKCIYKVLGQIKSECLKGAQEDAEEFLSSVLNGLHEEMIGLGEILQSTQESTLQNGNPSDIDDANDDLANDDNLWREVGPKNRSLPIRTAKVINTSIQEIFGGSLFSIRTAGKDRCGHRSPFFDLQLDISSDNVKSVQDAIKSFTAPEVIHDFYCTKTKQKLDAQRRTSLDLLPPILILHLKQFVYTQDYGLKKLMKKIEYPVDFELPENCLHDKSSTDKSLRTSRSYKLLAVVYHEGKEAVKGHYLTDVYHIGSNQWIRCDDSNLKVIQSPHIENPDSTRTPYLLFYRRLNTLVRTPWGNHDNKKKS